MQPWRLFIIYIYIYRGQKNKLPPNIPCISANFKSYILLYSHCDGNRVVQELCLFSTDTSARAGIRTSNNRTENVHICILYLLESSCIRTFKVSLSLASMLHDYMLHDPGGDPKSCSTDSYSFSTSFGCFFFFFFVDIRFSFTYARVYFKHFHDGYTYIEL